MFSMILLIDVGPQELFVDIPESYSRLRKHCFKWSDCTKRGLSMLQNVQQVMMPRRIESKFFSLRKLSLQAFQLIIKATKSQ